MNKEELLKVIDKGIERLLQEPTEVQQAFENGCRYTMNAFQYFLNYCEKLEKENQELKEIEKEHQKMNGELRVEIKEYQKELEKADSITQSCIFNGKKESEISYRKALNKLEKTNKANKELKEQYNDLVEEKEKLQEQLSINTLQLEEMKLSKRDYTQENILTMKLTLKENQQKEFIEYLEHQVKLQEELNDIHLATGFEEILSKYKSIIGGKE